MSFILISDTAFVCGRCGFVISDRDDVQRRYCHHCQVTYPVTMTDATTAIRDGVIAALITTQPGLYETIRQLLVLEEPRAAIMQHTERGGALPGSLTHDAVSLTVDWLSAHLATGPHR